MSQTPRDVSAAEPDSIYQMIGQIQVRNQVITSIEACQNNSLLFDSPVLMVGGGGLGKSQTGQCIANMLAATSFNIVLAQSLKTPANLAACFLEQPAGGVLFLDEAGGLTDAVQLAMYLAIDKKKVFLSQKGSSPLVMDIEPFVLLLATTHEFQLNDSLRQRCRMTLRFSHYSVEELCKIAEHRARGVGWNVDQEVFYEAARRGKGTPRIVLRLLNAAQRMAKADQADVVTLDHFRKNCLQESIDREGLDYVEQQYMKTLLNGPQRLNMLAAKLALPTKTISDVIEGSYLFRGDLVEKDDQSRRTLTKKGRKHALLLQKGEGYE
ncbi:MAG: Holliday junction DNA helicase RuvB C-terminal domain-containing protein [Pirellulales bacterium]